MVMTKNRIDIRNAMSLNEHGITYEELVYEKNQEVEAAKEAVEATAKQAAEKAEARAIKSIHAMIKEGFAIQKIAYILDLDVDYAEKLAENNLV